MGKQRRVYPQFLKTARRGVGEPTTNGSALDAMHGLCVANPNEKQVIRTEDKDAHVSEMP